MPKLSTTRLGKIDFVNLNKITSDIYGAISL